MRKHLPAVALDHPSVECVGVLGLFDMVPSLLEKSPTEGIMSLGSTLSNTSRENLIKILQVISKKADIIVLGQDGNTDVRSVQEAYSTPAFNAFIQEGIKEKYPPGEWQHEVRILHNPFRVQRIIRANEQIGEHKEGATIVVFEAYKYPQEEFIAIVRAIPGFKVEAFPALNNTSCQYPAPNLSMRAC
jgi:hypothetical protein